jgi:hypothetical protein
VLVKRKFLICMKTITKFLLGIYWSFFMKGIHIEPASVVNETRLNIQSLENCQSDEVKIIRSGMLPNLFIYFSLRFLLYQ